jgi:hypothetical protein
MVTLFKGKKRAVDAAENKGKATNNGGRCLI